MAFLEQIIDLSQLNLVVKIKNKLDNYKNILITNRKQIILLSLKEMFSELEAMNLNPYIFLDVFNLKKSGSNGFCGKYKYSQQLGWADKLTPRKIKSANTLLISS